MASERAPQVTQLPSLLIGTERLYGVVERWSSQGFGFVLTGMRSVFVHASALPQGTSRLRVGQALTFSLGTDLQGRVQAMYVRLEG